MAKLEYSQVVRRKMSNLKSELLQTYGEEKAISIMKKLTSGVRILESFPESGIKVSSVYDIDCDYRYIFIEQNYFFYRMEGNDKVLVLEMFNEREDFMRKLFGVITTSQETIDYWGE